MKGVITTIGNEQVARLITGKGGVPFDIIVLGSGETPALKTDTRIENEITTNGLQRKTAEIRVIGDKIEYTASWNCTAETRVTEIGIINSNGLLFYRDTTIKKTYIAGERVTITIVLNYV